MEISYAVRNRGGGRGVRLWLLQGNYAVVTARPPKYRERIRFYGRRHYCQRQLHRTAIVNKPAVEQRTLINPANEEVITHVGGFYDDAKVFRSFRRSPDAFSSDKRFPADSATVLHVYVMHGNAFRARINPMARIRGADSRPRLISRFKIHGQQESRNATGYPIILTRSPFPSLYSLPFHPVLTYIHLRFTPTIGNGNESSRNSAPALLIKQRRGEGGEKGEMGRGKKRKKKTERKKEKKNWEKTFPCYRPHCVREFLSNEFYQYRYFHRVVFSLSLSFSLFLVFPSLGISAPRVY